MADQGRWWKLWTSAISDPSLAELNMSEVGRWCWFGAYMKLHGSAGCLKVPYPANSLQSLFRVTTFEEVVNVLKAFPNCDVLSDNVSITVKWANWEKYQRDPGYERLKKFRLKHRTQETLSDNVNIEERRREEKRGEEVPPTGVQGVVMEWPKDIAEVHTYLKTIHAPPNLHDPVYWQRIETWMRNGTGYSVAYLDELDAYLAWWESKPAGQRHKNLKKGLRNWLSKALVMEQNREQKSIFKDRRRPKDAFGRPR